jgi:hypothetical protein
MSIHEPVPISFRVASPPRCSHGRPPITAEVVLRGDIDINIGGKMDVLRAVAGPSVGLGPGRAKR